MPEWLTGLVPILPLVAALWMGLNLLFGRVRGEAGERPTSRVALMAAGGSLAAVLVLITARWTGRWPGWAIRRC